MQREKASRQQLTTLAAAIYRYLCEHGCGAHQAVEAKRLAAAVGIPYVVRPGQSPGTRVWTAVRFAVEHGYLICGGPSGYYVPASRAEVTKTTRDLHARAKAMQARAATLDRNAARHFEGRMF